MESYTDTLAYLFSVSTTHSKRLFLCITFGHPVMIAKWGIWMGICKSLSALTVSWAGEVVEEHRIGWSAFSGLCLLCWCNL